MLSISDLPLLNAILNATSATLLVLGHRQIEQKNIQGHKKLMISVFITSASFLVSYVIYHAAHGSQPFQGSGPIRTIYFAILLSHTIGAVTIVPVAIITLIRGLRRQDQKHISIAKWTYPLWLFVSVTGVIIYLMLYQLFPGS